MALEDRLRSDAAELEHDVRGVQAPDASPAGDRPAAARDTAGGTGRARGPAAGDLDRLVVLVGDGGAARHRPGRDRGAGGDGAPRPTVLLRGDMDALPVQELTGVEFTSTIDGAMHACGHDLHTAMLVGAARLLSAHQDALAGDVVFMFQPGEEGWDGAGHMLAEGVLDAAGTRVQRAYGMHVISGKLPRHQFTTRPGTLMAASDGLMVTVKGTGGHGSAPHRAKDPVSVAAEMITALQAMVTRQFDIFDPVVITVGSFHAGTRRNIIPEEAVFDATVRSFSRAARERIQVASVRLCEAIAAAHGLEADARYNTEYPVTVNDVEQAAFATGVVADVFGEDRFAPMLNPEAGAEDFSRVLEEVPGCYLFLGACPDDDYQAAQANHSPYAAFDDAVMTDGCLLHANLAIRALQDLGSS